MMPPPPNFSLLDTPHYPFNIPLKKTVNDNPPFHSLKIICMISFIMQYS